MPVPERKALPGRRPERGAALLAVLLLAGCAARERVILLPDAQGQAGSIAVLRGSSAPVIDQPYATATIDTRGGVRTAVLDAGIVRQLYAAELAGLPPRPERHSLYFLHDAIQLTETSEVQAPVLLAQIVQRPDVEVTLVGHADTRGARTESAQLALMRALLVRARLVNAGLNALRIRIAAEDKDEVRDMPAMPPDDEPRGRRVDLFIR